ncbi:MAG: hypothetical protein IPP96_09220 [Chitinophagaceae bacterium]|nr:hypothetical protein [Chitinophagaceae bacterium]
MNQENTADVLNVGETKKLPSGLNVLTILTFIGCGIFGLLTLLTPVINKFFLNLMDKAASSGQDLSAKQLADMEKGRAAIELTTQHMIPLITVGMVGIILCFIGALWMRKLKKDGYWIYVAGELAPILAMFFIMGTAQYTSIWSYIIGIGIPVLFVILYTLQRKHLVK